MTGLARVHFARFDIPAARKMANRAIKTEPENFRAWFVRAQVALRGGSPSAALENLNRSIELEPDHAADRISRAIVLLNLNRFGDVQPDLDVIGKDAPEGSDLALSRADVLLRNIDNEVFKRYPSRHFVAGMVSHARAARRPSIHYHLGAALDRLGHAKKRANICKPLSHREIPENLPGKPSEFSRNLSTTVRNLPRRLFRDALIRPGRPRFRSSPPAGAYRATSARCRRFCLPSRSARCHRSGSGSVLPRPLSRPSRRPPPAP